MGDHPPVFNQDLGAAARLAAAQVALQHRRLFYRPSDVLRRLGQLLLFVRHWHRYRGVRAALRACEGGRLLARSGMMPCKFLGAYLTPVFRLSQRAAAQVQHYRLSARQFPRLHLADTPGEHEVWRFEHHGEEHAIAVLLSDLTFMEGEWTLEYRLDGRSLYIMTVTVIPGALCGHGDDNVVFIGGSQGRPGTHEAARHVAKCPHMMSPANALFLAARALAEVLGLSTLVAVTVASKLPTPVPVAHHRLEQAYDALWRSHGAIPVGDFLHMAACPQERPLSDISAHHRQRARKRREARRVVLAALVQGWQGLMGAEAER